MRNRKEIEARFRLELLLQVEKMLGKKPFEQLSIVKLSEKMGVSKVTIYNVYFSRREDILAYYFQVWCLKLTVNFLESQKDGLDGITALADRLCELFSKHPGIVRGWIYYSSLSLKNKRHYSSMIEEKKLLFPKQDLTDLNVLTIDEMIEQFVSQAVKVGEISKKTSVSEISSSLIQTLIGFFITVQPAQVSQLKESLHRTMTQTLKGFQ